MLINIFFIILLILWVWLLIKGFSVISKIEMLTKKQSKNSGDIDHRFNKVTSNIDLLKYSNNELLDKIEQLERDSEWTISKIGLEKYDPDAKGEMQSFSLALLNNKNKGVVIKYNNKFIKPEFMCIKIDADGSDKELSKEDIKALENAVN